MLEQLTKKRVIQELLASEGWQLFVNEVLVKYRNRELRNLEVAGSRGDGLQCAKHAHLLEQLPVIIKLMENELKGS